MRVSSFDIFDTCLLRKCGTTDGFYDVLACRVFNGEVSDQIKRTFTVSRKKSEDDLWNRISNLQLIDIYNNISFSHTLLKSVDELVEIECALETEMLVPSAKAKKLIDNCRKHGDRIIFISDTYLPDSLLCGILTKYGLFKEGDGLYISSTCGCNKQTGELFKYISNHEHISFSEWHHYGDNKHNDVFMPSSLGIKSTLFTNDYSPYQLFWLERSNSACFDYRSILAGISRHIRHSDFSEHEIYCNFVADLIAPFYCSYVYNILKDAHKRGLRHLFFCARDTYQIYQIAKRMTELFPEIHIYYLHISRVSLYSGDEEAQLSYFTQIGLARHDNSAAIVDITTSGKTILELNRILTKNGFCSVHGYFFLLWDDTRNIPVDWNLCYFEVEARNLRNKDIGRQLLHHIYIFENFFALNTQSRTVNYNLTDGKAEPVFDNSLTEHETVLQDDRQKTSELFTSILTEYTTAYILTEVYRYSKEIMHELAITTLSHFFSVPELHYLPALEKYMVYNERTKSHVPYVVHSPKAILKMRSAESKWQEASILWSLPCFLRPLYKHRIKNR